MMPLLAGPPLTKWGWEGDLKLKKGANAWCCLMVMMEMCLGVCLKGTKKGMGEGKGGGCGIRVGRWMMMRAWN